MWPWPLTFWIQNQTQIKVPQQHHEYPLLVTQQAVTGPAPLWNMEHGTPPTCDGFQLPLGLVIFFTNPTVWHKAIKFGRITYEEELKFLLGRPSHALRITVLEVALYLSGICALPSIFLVSLFFFFCCFLFRSCDRLSSQFLMYVKCSRFVWLLTMFFCYVCSSYLWTINYYIWYRLSFGYLRLSGCVKLH